MSKDRGGRREGRRTMRVEILHTPGVAVSLALVLVCCLIFATRSFATPLKAGTAMTDVTPLLGHPMWGYSDRHGVSEKVLDPLHAKALVLDDGERKLAIVGLDLGRVPDRQGMQFIHDRVKNSTGITNLLIVASHTHQGTVVEDRTWPSPEKPWVADMEAKVAEVIEKANGNLREARIGTGHGKVYIGHNRRVVRKDGTVLMLWRDAERIPTTPVDPDVGVIRVDDTSGQPIAIVVSYACHPVVLGPDNLNISADYPGVMMEMVQRELGSTCIFLQGACGDINPYMDKTPIKENGIEEMKKAGEALGQEVVRVAQAIVTKPSPNAAIRFRDDEFDFEPRWDLESPGALDKLYKAYGKETVDRYIAQFKDMRCSMATTLINDNLALVGMPGEFFVEFQLDLKSRSPVKDTFFLGYCSGYQAYFPTIRAAAEGGYGAGYQTFVEVGAGERMVDRAVINLYRFLGKLQDRVPIPPMPVE